MSDKETAKKQTKTAVKKKTLRREDIPGYSTNWPDMSNWELAARALRVKPFYEGPDAVPFSRLRATQIPDPARGNATFNDFYLEHNGGSNSIGSLPGVPNIDPPKPRR
jgi:hypothetical protein